MLPSVVQAEGISVENETELDRQYSELFSKDTELTFHIQLEKINDHVEDVKAELFVTNIEKRSFIEETRPKLFLKDHTIPLSIELMEQDYKGANLILLGIIVLFMVAILMVYLNIKNRRKGRELNENESY
ncbi:WXG100 protein secretion system (Wss), protein EssA [Amphibacillus marinus]|uniref:WXG100 protein secretion system (Wss), protein EssA n=1 Tax=Amphibacillus marinus TaxID=872970 RepID=A0A1H8TV22_9BACI|nr:WXG100 protein secretion system (Wss), protein EssA [Amphibacillus marinus]